MSREILVRAPNWLGDLVMCTPAFRALRESFPGDRISLHAPAALLPVLDGAPWFDERIALRRQRAGAGALLLEARALRTRGRFDLGICLPDSWSSALLMRAAGVRRVVGYRRAGRGWLLQQPVSPPPGVGRRRLLARERHALGLATAAGAAAGDVRLELFTTPDEEARADAALAPHGLEAGGFLALAPGASFGGAKRWPVASFARVADAAAARGLAVCLLGAPGEEATTACVADAMAAPAADLGGRLDVGALKSVLRRARALVCNDAGARHVAVAFGVPCVVPFGPTSLRKTDCNLERVRALETDVDCRPCYRRECPIDHRCMTRIPPETVRDAVFEWLEERPDESGQRGRRGAENAGT